MNRSTEFWETLFIGLVAVVGALIGFYKAYCANAQRAMIPYTSGSMSPTQAFVGSSLLLGFGVFWLALSYQRFRK